MKIKEYTDLKEYEKAKLKRLKGLQKTYTWYKNIEEGMEFWEKWNILRKKEGTATTDTDPMINKNMKGGLK